MLEHTAKKLHSCLLGVETLMEQAIL